MERDRSALSRGAHDSSGAVGSSAAADEPREAQSTDKAEAEAKIKRRLKRKKLGPLEHRDRIERRTGAAANRQRRGRQQELPAVPIGSRLGQRLEIAVVE